MEKSHTETLTPPLGADPLWTGPSGYSSLTLTLAAPDTVFVLYERGEESSTETLRLTQVKIM